MSEIKSRNSAVVLAAHGVPATDFPAWRVGLLMTLEFSGSVVERIGFLRSWRERLEHEVRAWPRTAANDPYKAAVDELAARIGFAGAGGVQQGLCPDRCRSEWARRGPGG